MRALIIITGAFIATLGALPFITEYEYTGEKVSDVSEGIFLVAYQLKGFLSLSGLTMIFLVLAIKSTEEPEEPKETKKR